MDEARINTIIIDAIYNEEKKQFEVWSTDEANGVKALLLVQTHDDILQQLKSMMVGTLQIMGNNPITGE